MDAYAEEVGGEGEHRYILMCLVALEDPGLDDLPHPPAHPRPRRPPRAALEAALERDFEIAEIAASELAPEPQGETTPLEMGYVNGRDERCFRLR